METGILTSMLNEFVSTVTLGYSSLMPDAMYLMQFFIAIEIVLVGLWWAFGREGVSVDAIKKLTTIFLFLWILSNFRMLSRVLVSSLGKAGITASGDTIPISVIFDPSAIVDLGFRACEPVFQNYGGALEALSNPIDSMLMGFTGILVLLSYFFIAINMFLVVIEFYIFTVVSVLFIPFALFRPTSWLAEKAIGGTFSLGIKVMVLSLVIGLSYKFLQKLALPPDPELTHLLRLLFSAGFIAFITWHAPSIAASYFAGSPNLSAGSAAGFASVGGVATIGAARQLSPAVRQTAATIYQKAASVGSGAVGMAKKFIHPV